MPDSTIQTQEDINEKAFRYVLSKQKSDKFICNREPIFGTIFNKKLIGSKMKRLDIILKISK